jgi:hypothetical protein
MGKVTESAVRGRLRRQGYLLRKDRAATIHVNHEGGYMIVNGQSNTLEAGEGYSLSLDDVVAFADGK